MPAGGMPDQIEIVLNFEKDCSYLSKVFTFIRFYYWGHNI